MFSMSRVMLSISCCHGPFKYCFTPSQSSALSSHLIPSVVLLLLFNNLISVSDSVSTLKKDKDQLQKRLLEFKNSATDQINKIRVEIAG